MKLIIFFFILLCGMQQGNVAFCTDSSPESRILESQVLMGQGEYEQAAEILQEALVDTPDEPKLYYQLGVLYREAGLLQEAVDSYLAAINIHSGYISALQELAEVYCGQQKWDEAIAAYRQICLIDPTSAAPLFEIAMIYRDQGGEHEKQQLALQQAYRLNPDYVMQSARLENFEIDELLLRQEVNQKNDDLTSQSIADKKDPVADKNSAPALEPKNSVRGGAAVHATEKNDKTILWFPLFFFLGLLLVCSWRIVWKGRH